MKTLSIIAYAIGSILLVISCFTASISLTWWLGGLSILFLIAGCIFQYNSNKGHTPTHHGF